MEITEATFKRIVDMIGATQGRSMMHNYILLEVVIAFALKEENPDKFLSDMFERIMSRWEHGEKTAEDEQKKPYVEARWTADTFFSMARKFVQRRAP